MNSSQTCAAYQRLQTRYVWMALPAVGLALLLLGSASSATRGTTAISGFVFLQGASNHAATQVVVSTPAAVGISAGWGTALLLGCGALLGLRLRRRRVLVGTLLLLGAMSAMAAVLGQTSSDASGSYRLAPAGGGAFEAGAAKIEFHHAGYISELRTVTLAAGGLADLRLPAVTLRPISSPTEDILAPPAGVPDLDPADASDIFDETGFLYDGNDPAQIGVVQGTIQHDRVAVLRGKVLRAAGTGLAAVTVSILDHPEYGHTLSRGDGGFDLSVNGGQPLVVQFEKADFISAQRQVEVAWREFIRVPPVCLLAYDAAVTEIQMDSPLLQTARGTAKTDADGTRRATLLFPPSNRASLRLADGRTRGTDLLHVRATEFTVGAEGPVSMPAQLPAGSGYTYAVELSADEAVAAKATRIEFTEPVVFYLENFLDFPVGGVVPAGYLDRELGSWVPSDNGRVIRILAVAGGTAILDIDGDGQADGPAELAPLGITDTEQQRLATLYAAGQSLWRVPIPHFTPWDCNWPYGPPDDAIPPNQPEPAQNQKEPNSCEEKGSIIECQNQTLRESIALAGTGMRLVYRSDRMLGHTANQQFEIPLIGSMVPASLQRIDLDLSIAGRSFTSRFAPAPNLRSTFFWDAQDAYGRPLRGLQEARVKINYAYTPQYRTPADFAQSFARFSGTGAAIGGSRGANVINISQESRPLIGTWDARDQGLGGWTLSVHHAYDPSGKTLYLGDGRRRSIVGQEQIIHIVAGAADRCFNDVCGDGGPATEARFSVPNSVVAGPDGSFYISDSDNSRVRRVGPDGIITNFAGTGLECPAATDSCGDGGQAAAAQLAFPWGLAVGPDGSVYIADMQLNRVRRVGPDGIITTAAGTGVRCTDSFQRRCGDGGPAVESELFAPIGVDVGPDGSLYIADTNNSTIRRVSSDGIIGSLTRISAGAGGFGGEGGPASTAFLGFPYGVAVGPTGEVYIADTFNNRIRRIGLDGVITTVAGTGVAGDTGDGGPATLAQIDRPTSIDVGPDGSVYFTDEPNHRVRRISPAGTLRTIAGSGAFLQPPLCDGCLATRPGLYFPSGVSVAPSGDVYFADRAQGRVFRVEPSFPGFAVADTILAGEDGRELYVFDSSGRHLRTIDPLTSDVLFQFSYDTAGRLTAVTDGDGNRTAIERATDGTATGLVTPSGHHSAFTIDADGYLTRVADPLGNATQMTYRDQGGLLATLTDPRGGVHRYTYDAEGLLTRDESPAGAALDLVRTQDEDGFAVETTNALGRSTEYRIDKDGVGTRHRVNRFSDGAEHEEEIRADGRRETTLADGTVVVSEVEGDPRFAMLAPIQRSLVVTTPDGISSTSTLSREVTLADPQDPFSLQTLLDTMTLNGRRFTTLFEALTRRITVTTPANRRTTLLLDERNRVTEVQIPNLASPSFTYDVRGDLQNMSRGLVPDARTITFSRTQQGVLQGFTDPLLRETAIEHDGAGRITKVTMPGAREARYGYDTSGNVTSVQPPGRSPHVFSYTTDNLVERYTPPAAGSQADSMQLVYDGERKLDRILRPDGTVVDYQYDSDGRLSRIVVPQGSLQVAYNPTTAKVATITAPGGGQIAYTYDGGLLTRTAWSGVVAGSVERTYDQNLRIPSMTVNGQNPVAFQFDQDGLLTSAGSLTVTHDNQNGLVTQTSLGSVTTTLDYNSFGEVESFLAQRSGTTLYATDTTHDAGGRITERSETIGGATHTWTYEYDIAGRLVEVQNDGSTVEAYTYDLNGNRLTADTGGSPVTAIYDARDRMIQRGASTYTWTANGELASKTTGANTTTYSYDAFGNLLSVNRPAGAPAIAYVIDGQNRRVGKRSGGTLVRGWLYQTTLQVAVELDGVGNVVSRFVYATGRNVPSSMIRGGTTYRLIADGVGSVRLVVDTASGTIAQRLDYDAFGNVTQDTNPGFQPFGFAGGLYDPDTKLVRFGSRDFDPEAGRWTTRDPRLFGGGDTNLYVYAGNDPVNLTDANGEFLPLIIAGVLGLGTGVALGLLTNLEDELQPTIEQAQKQATSVPGVTPKGADALQHCIASCNVTRERGRNTAEFVGEVNELIGSDLFGEKFEGDADRYNNRRGCDVGEGAESSDDCLNACVGMLQSGALHTTYN